MVSKPIPCPVVGKVASLPQLRTTTYDRIVAGLISAAVTSLILLVAAIAVWIGEWRTAQNPQPIPASTAVAPLTVVELDAEQGNQSSAAQSLATAVESPSSTDELVSNNEEKDVADLEASVQSVQEHEVVAAEISELQEPKNAGHGLPQEASGKGTSPIGVGLSTGHTGARQSRWYIEHRQGADLRDYAKRLEAMEIQIGALIEGSGRFVYLTNLTDAKPTTVEINANDRGQGFSEKRMFLSWASGSAELIQADQDLFKLAGVDTSNAKIYHFLSEKSERTLERLELQYSGRSDASQIRRTFFGIRPTADGFEFFVIKQLIR